jgi:hypothetical protein
MAKLNVIVAPGDCWILHCCVEFWRITPWKLTGSIVAAPMFRVMRMEDSREVGVAGIAMYCSEKLLVRNPTPAQLAVEPEVI